VASNKKAKYRQLANSCHRVDRNLKPRGRAVSAEDRPTYQAVTDKKFELRLTRRAKAYSSFCSQTVSLSPAVFTKDWPTTVK